MIFSLLLAASLRGSKATYFVPKDTPAIEASVKKLLSEMTLDEKLAYIGGTDGFYVRAIPRLGLPKFKMSDGPVGLRNDGVATAYPAGVMLAASFNPQLAFQYGTFIGEDARARGVNFWLGPGVNLDRIPQNGRNFEYLGEDPILSGLMAAQIVRGVQSYGVCPTVKHFTGNDNEEDRTEDSSDIDERTLHELTMMPWEIAVKKGEALGVMTSYNLVNGTYMSENAPLLDILKHKWGYQGVVMSDWGSVHSVKGPYNAGLDLEMPSADEMSPANLKPLIENGTLSRKPLNDKVARILRVALELHWLDRPQKDAKLPYINPRSDTGALKIASEGITLLQNRDHLLPLTSYSKGTILVVGPNAEPPVTGGGGSSFVEPHAKIGLVTSLHRVAPNLKVQQIPYLANTSFVLDGKVTSHGEAGFTEELYNGKNLEGSPIYSGHVAQINNIWTKKGPGHGEGLINYSARWTGDFRPNASGKFEISARSDDGMRVWVNDKEVISMWQDQAKTLAQKLIYLSKDQTYKIKVEYYQAEGEAVAQVGISEVDKNLEKVLPAAEAKSAKTIIAYVGFNPSLESEGRDRTWQLPQDQQDLLNRACRLNKNVIIVLNAGGAVDLAPWIHKAKSIIDAYYPGENGDIALAKILVGKLDPSGHLPFVMPYRLTDLLSTGTYPAKNHQIHYKEGIFIGERGLDKQHIQPMFAFGTGLSYTTFNNRLVSVSKDGNDFVIQGRAANTGSRAGSEVIQAYISYPDSPVPMPVRELKGFQRISLHAHQTAIFTIRIPLSSLGYWNIHRHNWSYVPGAYGVSLGTSADQFFGKKSINLSRSTVQFLNKKAQP